MAVVCAVGHIFWMKLQKNRKIESIPGLRRRNRSNLALRILYALIDGRV